MVCDTVRHRPPAPVSLAGAAGAAGATAATALIVPTDLRRPGMAAAAATRFGSGAGDDWTTGDEDHREVDATLIAEAMSLLYSIRVRTLVGCMDGSVLELFYPLLCGEQSRSLWLNSLATRTRSSRAE